MRRTLTLFKELPSKLHPLLKGPEDPKLASIWQRMRDELSTQDERERVAKILASPALEADRKAISEALDTALKAGARNHRRSVYG